MKNYLDFPIDSTQRDPNPGEYMVCLDHDSGGEHFRCHLKKEGGYSFVDPETLDETYDGNKTHIYPPHPYFARLEPVMNLLGARKANGYAATFVATREELENILRG